MTQPDLQHLAIQCRNVSSIEAQVEARLPDGHCGTWQLAGHVTGPRCEFARTLPARIPLRTMQAPYGLYSMAIVADPCLWTPQLPMLYEVQVELRQDDRVISRTNRPLAIRMFGPRGRDFNLAGKRWVLRGVRRSLLPDAPLAAWRETGAAMLVAAPDDTLADEAARLGVPLVALVRAESINDLRAELSRLARFPSVVIAVIDAAAELPSDVPLTAPNILLAASCRDEDAPSPLPPWANVLLCESTDAVKLARAASGRPFPVIALRPEEGTADLATARRTCDILQRDLASHVDLAGYAV